MAPKTAPLNLDSRIVIAGAGVFGLSTALWLARSGYTNIVVLDPYPVPSQLSAANDINKIIRTEYHYPVYGGIAREAYELWTKEQLYSQHFHKVGWFTGAPGDDERGKSIVKKSWDTLGKDGVKTRATLIHSGAELKKKVPQTMASRNIDNIFGLFNPEAGWANSGRALSSVAEEAGRLGVKFIFGADGAFESLRKDEAGTVTGIIAQSGRQVAADHVILAMGASTASRIDCGKQVTAYGYGLAMIQLSPQEAALYKNMPVIHSKTLGYIFEPSEDGRLKVALPGRYAHHVQAGSPSEPEHHSLSYGNLPEQCRREMRTLLATFLPQLASRPFCYEQFCWDADTNNDNFLVSFIPEHGNRVLMATGGSYHGFKFFPIIGKYVQQALEGTISNELATLWRWRPEADEYDTRGVGETRVLRRYEAHL